MNDERNPQEQEPREHYPQEGVAVTCRSLQEYVAMFALEEGALAAGPMLDVAGGASSFTAEAAANGFDVTAADPRYGISAERLYADGLAEIASSTAKLERLQSRFDWTFYGSLEAHRAGREASLEAFIQHYRHSDSAPRRPYIAASLPHLPFPDDMFALTLCSHFLFLYEEQFSYQFHKAAMGELYRVTRPGGEVRVYPLRTLRFQPYPGLDELMRSFREEYGAVVDKVESRLPFIPESSQLLRITKPLHP